VSYIRVLNRWEDGGKEGRKAVFQVSSVLGGIGGLLVFCRCFQAISYPFAAFATFARLFCLLL